MDALVTGFNKDFSPASICAFRIALAVSLLIKFAVEYRRGFWHYYQPGAFLFELYTQLGVKTGIDPMFYRLAILLRPLAALLLLVGVVPQISAGFLFVCFIPELRVYFKYHACFMWLCCGALVFEPALGASFSIPSVTGGSPTASTDGFSATLIVLTTISLYLFSALRKLRSSDFRSGRAISASAFYTLKNAPHKQLKDHWYPAWFVQRVMGSEAQGGGFWKGLASVTILFELILPFMLCFDLTFVAGFTIGCLLHLSFTLMLPVTLTHFSLASVATYLCFIAPGAM